MRIIGIDCYWKEKIDAQHRWDIRSEWKFSIPDTFVEVDCKECDRGEEKRGLLKDCASSLCLLQTWFLLPRESVLNEASNIVLPVGVVEAVSWGQGFLGVYRMLLQCVRLAGFCQCFRWCGQRWWGRGLTLWFQKKSYQPPQSAHCENTYDQLVPETAHAIT